MAFSLRIFSVCPRISKRDGTLVAATAWRLRAVLLGCLYREVVVDPERREIAVHRRYGWLLRLCRRVRFDEVKAVTYGYEDFSMDGGLDSARDSLDLYSVGLRLQNEDELHLFYFFGDGTFTNDGPWPDWMHWATFHTDLSGIQERESRVFVDLLSKLIGVPVVPPQR